MSNRNTLPTGTVTFFFSDIEGSTRLLQQLGPRYRDVLATHNEIARAAFAQHGGVEIRTEGDAFFAVFTNARHAVDAAAMLQTGLADVDWPEAGTVRVRIGLHTGNGELGGDDYLGLDVHLAARIAATGHGGQVVVSETTKALARNADYVDLGSHRLKDIEQPEQLFQLVINDLPMSFPPLRSLDVRPNNLPTLPTPLLGREDEVTELLEMLRTNRIVTLVGLGGVGKSRLAVEVASQALPEFQGGAFLVDLAPLADPDLVLPAIAAELGIDSADVGGLAESIGGNTILVVLDGLERVTNAATDIGGLVASAPGLRVLMTSQAPLRLAGERLYRVDPLSLADGAASPAVRLFVERANAADPSFSLDDHADDVAVLVEALHGLPLAVELAASRVTVLTPGQIMERLSKDAMVLATRATDAPDRHRSLFATIEWSYGLLTPSQQKLVSALAVFRGGANLIATEAVAAADVLDDLGELIDRTMVLTEEGSAGKRYRVPESVNRFMHMQLDEETLAELRGRHTAFYCALGESAAKGLVSDRTAWWYSTLSDDHENLQAVLERMHSAPEIESGLSFLGDFWRYYQGVGRLSEVELWLERFFGLAGADRPSAGRVKGLMAWAGVKYWRGDAETALPDYEEAMDLARTLGDPELLADAIFGLMTTLGLLQRFDEAQELGDELRALYDELDDPWGEANIVSTEGFWALMQEGPSAARDKLAQASAMWEKLGLLADSAQLVMAQATGALMDGELDEAWRLVGRALEMTESSANRVISATIVESIASLLIANGDVEKGGELAGGAAKARSRMGGGWTFAESTGRWMPDAQTLLVDTVGEERAAELMAVGSDYSLDRVIELARAAIPA